jgi:hypothetical protein
MVPVIDTTLLLPLIEVGERVRSIKGRLQAIRDGFAATKDWKGMLITYQADAKGDLAHTLGIYRNKGKSPELAGTIKEKGF